MGTNNFYYKNMLAVEPDFNFYHDSEGCECEDDERDEKGICKMNGDYEDFDDWSHRNFIQDLQYDLEKIGFEIPEGGYFNKCSFGYPIDRNFGGRCIARVSFNFKDGDGYKEIEVLEFHGYYQGANIDYDLIEDDYYQGDRKTKLLDKQIEKKIKALEKTIYKHCERYIKVGQFSNGEAVYKKL